MDKATPPAKELSDPDKTIPFVPVLEEVNEATGYVKNEDKESKDGSDDGNAA